jgi:hypothetical protein
MRLQILIAKGLANVTWQLRQDTLYELAIAIVESLWIGCLSQMKENRLLANGARIVYPKGTTDNLKQVIIDAFDAGRDYAPQEEARRQQA